MNTPSSKWKEITSQLVFLFSTLSERQSGRHSHFTGLQPSPLVSAGFHNGQAFHVLSKVCTMLFLLVVSFNISAQTIAEVEPNNTVANAVANAQDRIFQPTTITGTVSSGDDDYWLIGYDFSLDFGGDNRWWVYFDSQLPAGLTVERGSITSPTGVYAGTEGSFSGAFSCPTFDYLSSFADRYTYIRIRSSDGGTHNYSLTVVERTSAQDACFGAVEPREEVVVPCTAPVAPSLSGVTRVDNSTLRLNSFPAVSGADGYIVQISENSSFSGVPSRYDDPIATTPSTVYGGSGDQIVANLSAPGAVDVSGLSVGPNYTFKVTPYKHCLSYYNMGASTNTTPSPTCGVIPGAPSSVSAVSPNPTTINFQSFAAAVGGATGYIAYISNTNSFTAPTAIPSASTTYDGTGQQAIYVGAGTNPNLTITGAGINPGSTYYIRTYTYELCNGTNFFDATGSSTSVVVCSGAPATPSTLSLTGPSHSTINVSAISPATDASGYVVLMNTVNSFTAPTSIPTANAVYSGSGEQVVYAGASSNPGVTVSGLSNINGGVTYYFKVFAYQNCQGNIYFESTGKEASAATRGAAQTVAGNAVFFEVRDTFMDLKSFTGAVGATGHVIKMNTVNSFTVPADGSASLPTASTAYAGGEQVIYAGTSATPDIRITGLTASTTYYFTIYTYSDVDGQLYYNQTGYEFSQLNVKPDPTITFDNFTSTYGDAAFHLPLSSNSNGVFAYQLVSQTAGGTSLSGPIVTVGNPGTVEFTANQAADANYNPGTASATMTIGKANPVIQFDRVTVSHGTADQTLMAVSQPAGVAALASTGTISYSIEGSAPTGNVLSGTNNATWTTGDAGSFTIRASITEDVNYVAGFQDATFTVGAPAQVFSITETKLIAAANGSATTLTSFGGSLGTTGTSYALIDNKLWVTTRAGGANGRGVLFTINLDGTSPTVIADLPAGSNAVAAPQKLDGKIWLVGWTSGAFAQGEIYTVNLDGSNFQTVHTFGLTGFRSVTGSLLEYGGKIYGTCSNGDAASSGGGIFSLTPDGSGGYTYAVERTITSVEHNYRFPYSGLVTHANKLWYIAQGTSGGSFLAAYNPVTQALSDAKSAGSITYDWKPVVFNNNIHAVTNSAILRFQGDFNPWHTVYSFVAPFNNNFPPTYDGVKLYGHGFNSGTGTGILYSLNPDGTDFQTLYTSSTAELFIDNAINVIAKLDPVLTFPDQTVNHLSVTNLNATSPSTGAITYELIGDATSSVLSGNEFTAGNAGTVTIRASVAEDVNYSAATHDATYTIQPVDPTFTISDVVLPFGSSVATLTPSANNYTGGTISYEFVDGGSLTSTGPNTGSTISGDQLTVGTPGSETIRATLPATSNFNARTVDFQLTVENATADLSGFVNITAEFFQSDVTLSVPSAPGIAVSYELLTSNTGSSLSGTNNETLSIGNVAGTETIRVTVNQANYVASTKDITLTVNKATPVLSWATPADITVALEPLDASRLNATASVPGTFSYFIVESVDTEIPVTVGTTPVEILGSVQLSALFTPTDLTNYAVTSTTVNINVTQIDLQITLDDKVWINTQSEPGLTYSITGGSLRPATASRAADVMFIPIQRAAGTALGTYPITVDGSVNAGLLDPFNTNICPNGICIHYNTAAFGEVQSLNFYSITVIDGTFTITDKPLITTADLAFSSPPSLVYDGTAKGFTVTPDAGLSPALPQADLDITYEGRNGTIYSSSTTAPTDAGDYTVTATVKASNPDYAGSVSENFTIARFATSISLNLPGTNPVFNGSGQGITPTANDISSNPTLSLVTEYSVSGANSFSETLPINAGTYDVRVNLVALETNYTAPEVTGVFTIDQTSQTITFNAIPDVACGQTTVDLTLYATSSSGATLTFASDDPAVATVAGNIATIVGAGTATITASQAGDVNSLPAADQQRTLTVAASQESFTVDNPADVTLCGGTSYTLPALTSGNYFSGPGGTGTAYNAGDVISSAMTMYVYGVSATSNMCMDENTFQISFPPLPPVDNFNTINRCGPYTLPTLTNGSYYTLSGGPTGGGMALSAGQAITTSQQIYIYNEVATCNNESSFMVNIGSGPSEQTVTLDNSAVACGPFDVVATIPNAQADMRYTLRNDADNSVLAGPLAGTDGPLSFPTQNIATTTTFNVLAQQPQDILQFESTGYVDVMGSGLSTQFASNRITVETWAIIPSSDDSDNFSALVSQEYDGTSLMFQISNEAGQLSAGFFINPTWYWVRNVDVPKDTWVHIAATYDQSNIKLYINGVEAASTAATVALPSGNTSNWNLGKVWSAGATSPVSFFGGALAETRIWNVAKTAGEISANMNTFFDAPQSNLVAHFNYGNKSGTTVSDRSGNGYNGTMTSLTGDNTNWQETLDISSSCDGELMSKPVFTVAPVQDQTLSLSQPTGATADVSLLGSQLNVDYYLRDHTTGAVVQGPVAGTGSPISFATENLTADRTYSAFGTQAGSTLTINTMTFDGVNDHIRFNNPSISGDNITVETWAYIPASELVTDGNITSLVTQAFVPITSAFIKYGLHLLDGKLRVGFFDGAWRTIDNVDIPADQWVHIASTYDGSTINVYIDGVSQGSAVINRSLPGSTREWYLGKNYVENSAGEVLHFSGSLAETRIWNEVRTVTQINDFKHAKMNGSEANLSVYFPYTDGSGTTLTDGTGNGLNGTLTFMAGDATNWTNGPAGLFILDACSGIFPSTVTAILSSVTITSADITFNDPASGFIYDGTEKAFTVTPSPSLSPALPAADIDLTYVGRNGTTYASSSTAPVNVGDYTVTATVNGSNTDYEGSVTHDFSITPVGLSVTGLAANNKVYDKTTTATTAGTAALSGGAISGDVVTLTGTPTFAFASVDVATGIAVNTSGYTLSGADAGNYDLTQPSFTADITAKALTVDVTANHKIYDGNATATVTLGSPALLGIVGDDVVTIDASPSAWDFDDANAGTGKAVTATGNYTITGAAATNYTLTQPSGLTANITTKELTVDVTADNKTYDGNTTAMVALGSPSLIGIVGSDVVTIDALPSAWDFDDANVGTGKAVTATGNYTITGAGAANYTLTQPSGLTADITAKALTVDVAADHKTYDGNTTAMVTLGSPSLLGIVGSDVVTIDSSPSAWDFDNANVGTGKAVTATGNYTIAGASAGNYTLTQPSGLTADIMAKALTVDVTADDKTYDGNPTATVTLGSPSLLGIVGSDVVTIDASPSAWDFDNANVGTGKAVTATGNYTIAGASAGNYTLTQPSGLIANITAKSLIVNVTADDKTYDGNTTATVTLGSPSLLGIVSGDVITIDASPSAWDFDNANVGTGKAVTATGNYTIAGASAGNYTLTQPSGLTANITAKALTVTADSKTITYGDDQNAGHSVTYSGFILGESSADLSGSLSFANITQTNAGTYVGVIVPSGLTSSNYAISFVDGDLTINQKALSITADNKTITYGENQNAGHTVTYSGFITGESSADLAGSLSFANITQTNAGTYVGVIVPSGLTSSNYSISFVDGDLTINPLAITITADARSKTYGDLDPSLTYQVTTGALQGSDMLTGSLTRVAGENVGTYLINQGTLSAGSNYTLTYVSDDLTIGTRAITVTADAQSKTYGDLDPTFTYQVTSGALQGGDMLTGSLTRVAGENAGMYAINQGSLAASSNYVLSYVPANLTVGTRAITITADDKNKTVGQADPTLTFTVTSGALQFSDAVSGSLTRVAGETVGTYAINQGSVGVSANYNLTFVPGTLTITDKIIQTISFSALVDVTYGDASFTLSATGGASGNPVTFASSNPAVATVSGTTVTIVGAGMTNITASQVGDVLHADAADVVQPLTVNARALEVTADAQSKTYGDTDPTLTWQLTSGSLVSGDMITGSPERVAGENAGTYAINQGTLDAGSNYNLTFVPANLSIGTRAITVTADAQSKIYGQADPGLTYQITTGALQGSDMFSGSLERAAGERVGTYSINQGTLTLSANYALTYVPADLTISARALEITADAQSKTYGDADPTLTYQITGGALQGSDVLSGSLSRAVGENIGTYAINQGALDAGSNYAVTYISADLTIGTRAITVTADAQSKMYGAVDPTLTYQVTSGALQFSDAFSGTLSRAAGENVGTYAINQGSLDAGSNYVVSFVPANLTISTRAITVSADMQNKVYGDADPTLTYQVTAGMLQMGDAFTGSLTRDAGENVGTYAINRGTLALSANYDLTYVGSSLTISQRDLTIAADDKVKTTGSADPALTYRITNGSLQFSDVASGSLARNTGETAGSYMINQGTLDIGSNYNLTFVPGVFTITDLITQTITFNPLSDVTYGDAAFALTATGGGSGNAVTYVSSNTSVATVSGSTVTIVGVGTTNITASQVGDATHAAAADVVQSLTVNRAALTVTADNQTRVYAASNPTLTASYSGFVNGEDASVLTIQPMLSTIANTTSDVGTYPITVAGGSAANYDLTYVNGTLTITKATQAITFDPLNDVDISVGTVSLMATSSSGLAVTYSLISGPATLSGSTLTLTGTGVVEVAADQIGNNNYEAATQVTRSFTVSDGSIMDQTITFDALANVTYGATTFDPGATASSGLTVTYSSSDETVATVNGSMITVVGAGTTTITASQVGNATFNAAPSVTQILTVDKAQLTITADDQTINEGQAIQSFTFSASGFVNGEDVSVIDVLPTVSSVANLSSLPGTYEITLTGGSDDNYNLTLVNGTLTILQVLNVEIAETIKVYPNPVTDYVIVESTKATVMEIYSQDGRLLKAIDLEGERVDLADLRIGLYLLQLKNESGEVIHDMRLVKKNN